MNRLFAFVVVAGIFPLALTGAAQEPKKLKETVASADKPRRQHDSFTDQLGLKWKPVREDKTHWSLKKHAGHLTITTQRGTIHRDEKSDDVSGGLQAKNLFVIGSPIMGRRDFVLSTCLVDFQPSTHWQQAGLLLYNDDDNYAKFILEYNGSARVLTVLTEVEQDSTILPNAAPEDTSKLFLRIVREGDKYQTQASQDGKDYKNVQQFEWKADGPFKIGLIAKNGGNPRADEIEARFDFFDLQWK